MMGREGVHAVRVLSACEESHPSQKKNTETTLSKSFLNKIFHWQNESEVRSTPYRTQTHSFVALLSHVTGDDGSSLQRHGG